MTIKVTEKHDSRFYQYKNKNFPSVTTIIGKFENKDNINKYLLNIGKKEIIEKNIDIKDKTDEEIIIFAKKIGEENNKKYSDIGKKFHSNIENYIKNPSPENKESINKFWMFLDNVNNIYSEKRLIYLFDEDNGFGGTPDNLSEINGNLFVDGNNNTIFNNQSFCVVDYKNPKRLKYNKERNRDGNIYFPFISYSLQLSAYSASFNQLDSSLRINKAFLVLCHPKCRRPTIYYYSPTEINFFWNEFKKIYWCFVNNEFYDWKVLETTCYENNLLGTKVSMNDNFIKENARGSKQNR